MSNNTYVSASFPLEKIIIASMIYKQGVADEIYGTLIPDYFCSEICRRIFIEIGRQLKSSSTIDISSVLHVINTFFKDNEGGRKDLEFIEELQRYSQNVFSSNNAVTELQNHYLVRNIYKTCSETIQDINKSPVPRAWSDYLDKLYSLSKLANSVTAGRSEVLTLGALAESLRSTYLFPSGGERPTPTGFEALDNKIKGLQKGDLVVIGARPSMGKTSLAINMALSASKEYSKELSPRGVLFISLEMEAKKIASRLLNQIAGVNFDLLYDKVSHANWLHTLDNCVKTLSKLNLTIDDEAIYSLEQLISKIKKYKATNRIECVFVDYLQLLKYDARSLDRYKEITEITRALKVLAKETNICIILLSQLSRALEGRTSKRPQMYDLKESGSIEQDADIILLIYREQYYKNMESSEEEQVTDNKGQLFIAKNRNGPVGNVNIEFEPEICKFTCTTPVKKKVKKSI